jgi:hypothetical protein
MPDTRASDADRDRAAELLRGAAAEGRLTVDELDERVHEAYSAVTQADLERLVADVRVTGSFLPEAGAPAAGDRVPVAPGEDGTARIVSVLGGSDRRGRWRLAPVCRVVNILGGADLDLTQVELTADVTELSVFSLMGGSDISLPEHLNVELSEFAFMGGNDLKVGDSRPDPGGPLLRLRIVSIMGGTGVRRGPKPTLKERLAARRQRRLER